MGAISSRKPLVLLLIIAVASAVLAGAEEFNRLINEDASEVDSGGGGQVADGREGAGAGQATSTLEMTTQDRDTIERLKSLGSSERLRLVVRAYLATVDAPVESAASAANVHRVEDWSKEAEHWAEESHEWGGTYPNQWTKKRSGKF